jgi:hypothetical protein
LNVAPVVVDLDDMLTFSSLFTWDETVEGYYFWDDINSELEELELFLLIDEILEDVSSTKEIKEQPKQYLVYVEGKQAPRKVHNSLKSAQKEANRLAKREVGYVTYVVEVVSKYIATVSVEEIK